MARELSKLPKGFVRMGAFGVRKALAAGQRQTILLYDMIGETYWGDGMTAKSFRSILEGMGGADLDVRFNCPGGSVYDGIAMYHALLEYAGDVRCIVDGIAASMASVIMLAGDTVVIKQGAQVMIHNAHTICMGDADALRHEADVIEQMSDGMADIYAQQTGVDKKKWRKMMDEETWFSAEGAVDAGLADSIDATGESIAEPDETAMQPEGLKALWNFAGFKHAPACTAGAMAVGMSALGPKENSEAALSLLKKPGAAAAAPLPTKETHMTPEELAAAKAAQEKKDREALEEAKRVALKQDADRRAAIATAFTPFGAAHAKLQKQCEDNQECTVEQARAALLDAVAKLATPTPGVVEPGVTEGEKFVAGASAVLLHRGGIERVAAKELQGNPFMSMSLRELAREALMREGIRAGLGDIMQMVGMAFTSTSDFPAVLEAVINKALLKGYGEYEETFPKFTSTGSISDFRPINRSGLGEFSNLDELPEGAEYKYGKFGDHKEVVQLATYGKMFSLTRQVIINDDLNAMTDIPRKMGRSARRTVGNIVWAILTGNPLMGDAVALFHASHSNILSNAADNDLTAANLAKAASQMAVQKEANGNDPLNIRPMFLIVPVALEIKAKILVESQYDPDQVGSLRPNPIRGMFTVVSDARLDAVSTTAWYLAASPSAYDTIEVSYLNGNETPFMDQLTNWNIDGTAWKVRIDAVAKALDWRTLLMSDGTNPTA